MSKTTARYGNPRYCLHTTIDANPEPSRRAVEQRNALNTLAVKHFSKQYDNLSDKDKSTLHFNLNTGKYDTDTE